MLTPLYRNLIEDSVEVLLEFWVEVFPVGVCGWLVEGLSHQVVHQVAAWAKLHVDGVAIDLFQRLERCGPLFDVLCNQGQGVRGVSGGEFPFGPRFTQFLQERGQPVW